MGGDERMVDNSSSVAAVRSADVIHARVASSFSSAEKGYYIRPPQVIVWVTVGELVFLRIHTVFSDFRGGLESTKYL